MSGSSVPASINCPRGSLPAPSRYSHYRRSLLLLLLCLCLHPLAAQISPHATALQEAYQKRQLAPARLHLARLMAEPAPRVDFQTLYAAENLLKEGQERSYRRSRTDSLLQFYRFAARVDSGMARAWYAQMGWMAQSRLAGAPDQLAVLTECYHYLQLEFPLSLLETYATLCHSAWKKGQQSLLDWLLHVAAVDRTLQAHSLIRPGDPAEAEEMQRRLYHALLLDLPACADAIAALGINPVLLPERTDWATALLLVRAVRLCPEDATFQAAGRLPAQDLLYLRLAAADALNREEYARAEGLYQRLETQETDDRLRAAAALSRADLCLLQGKYSAAWQACGEAVRQHPAWGEPWMHCAAIARECARTCTAAPFDRKSLYWLAMQCARRAGNVDPLLEAEAAQAWLRYRNLAPNAAEVHLMRLRSGDSWALRCLPGTVTIVP